MEQAELERAERMLNREVKARFPAGAVRRVALQRTRDDPEELLVRVFIDGPGEPGLGGWAQAHEARMKRLQRELSLRLPAARRLEFAIEDDPGPRITMPIDPGLADEARSTREIVETAVGLLRMGYVYPDRAEQAATAIEARLAVGEYDDLDEASLAERLTGHLHEICADGHLRVRTMPPRPQRVPREHGEPPGRDRDRRPWERPLNYGIHRAERLAGNIGYLDLHGVPFPEDAAPVIAAAMELVSGTYALIMDLRQNHGGSPHGVVFWCSYLFPGADTHLSDIFDADTGETRQFWSLAYVPGSRYLDRPVYVLTSHETFSGGEDLCYTLQAQGRAEVIGETTGGGAHPTRMVPISSTIAISLPHARSVNPVTGTNWQGTGVVPDVVVPAAQAYDVAYGKAVRHVLSCTVPRPITDEARAALAALPAVAQD